MSRPFIGDPWDDRDWFRSSRWNEQIAEDFERRLARSRGQRNQYLRLQGLHLCAQPDAAFRQIGRALLRRAIDEATSPRDSHAARQLLIQSLADEGELEAALDEHRLARTAIAETENVRGMPGKGDALALAEAFLRRRGGGDVAAAAGLLAEFDTNRLDELPFFRELKLRYVLAQGDLSAALGDEASAHDWAAAARELLDEPITPVRPVHPADSLDIPASEALASIVTSVGPMLKAAGFRKRRHSFNRSVADGITHVLSFQAGRSDPPGHDGNPVFESFHGRFTVNLSVHVPGMRNDQLRSPWVNEYDGHLRARLGALADPESRDVWWDPRHPDAADDLAGVIRDFGLPWLARFPDVDSVVEQWLSGDAVVQGSLLNGLLDIAPLMVTRGRAAEVEPLLREYLRGDLHRGHRDYLAGFLPTIGMGHLLPEFPSGS
jgi:hypothetical protein